MVLELGNGVEVVRVLRYSLKKKKKKKAKIFTKGHLKVILTKTWKEKRRAGEKSSNFLDNTQIFINKILVEILTVGSNRPFW